MSPVLVRAVTAMVLVSGGLVVEASVALAHDAGVWPDMTAVTGPMVRPAAAPVRATQSVGEGPGAVVSDEGEDQVLLVNPASDLTPEQRRKIQSLIRGSAAREARDPVRAFLLLSEAYRLEQIWIHNAFDGDRLSERAYERFLASLWKRQDDGVMRLLRSPLVGVNDKLNLLRRLEQEVILSYPGRTWENRSAP